MNPEPAPQLEDRRAAPRTRTSRPCKIFDPLSRKYIPAQTLDVSEHGALISVDRPLELPPGTDIFVGVTEHPAQAVVRFRDMRHASVIRLLRGPGRATTIALEYTEGVRTADQRRRAA